MTTATPLTESRSPYSAASVVKAVVGTVVAAWVLAWVYGPVEHWSPIVYLNIVLAFGYGWAVGVVGRGFLRRSRIDSRRAATVVGVLGGLAAVWFAWATYLWVLAGYNFEAYLDLLTNPFNIRHLAAFLSENPAWSIGRRGRSAGGFPAMYYMAWVLELVVVVGAAVMVCRDFIKENVLCRHCNDWVAKTDDTAAFAFPDDPAGLFAGIANGDLSGLASLPRLRGISGDAGTTWLSAQGFACPNCGEDAECHVTVNQIRLEKNKKGEIEPKTTILARFVTVSHELEAALFDAPPAAEETATPAEAGEDEAPAPETGDDAQSNPENAE